MPPLRYAVLFPGQGSQFVGMGADLFDAGSALLGDRTDAILGWSLRRMCLEGDEAELTRTEHAQPALFAVAAALWQEVSPRLPHPPAATAGHSLGEYTALFAAGALAYDDALRVVAERGRAMADAADAQPSGMAALIGADVDTAEEACGSRRAEGGRLWVANINDPKQVVVAGAGEDLDWLESNARDLGLRRVVRLKVAGAFHSPFMEPAAERVEAALAGAHIAEPSFDVYANVTGAPAPREEIRGLLASQVVSPVRFADTLRAMADAGIGTFVHVGPGDVTAGMARRTVPDAEVLTVSSLDDVDEASEALSRMSGSGGE